MDNVIADVELNYLIWYEKETGVVIPREALRGLPEAEYLPDKAAVLRYLNTPGFFRTAPLVAGAQEGLKRLMENFEVYIVSAAMQFPQSLPEKYDWLSEHFPFISWTNIVFCGDKSVIGTDYMIDDHVKNLDFFKGKPFLFTASHNIEIDRHARVNNWKEAVEELEKKLY